MKNQMVENFFEKNWPEISRKVPAYIKRCVETCGTVVTCDRQDQIIAVGLFTLGTPDGDYKDKNNGYIILLLTEVNGLSSPFYKVMFGIIKHAIEHNCDQIFFKCCIDQHKEIKLYKKFAKPIRSCTNLSGEQCILFHSNTIELKCFFDKYVKHLV